MVEVVSGVAAHVRRLFGFGKLAWIGLLGIFLMAWGGPAALRMIGSDLVPRHAALARSCGVRGPWVGSIGDDGHLRHPAGDADTVFHPGDLIVWETCWEVVPGVTVSAESTLWCDGHPVVALDFHVYRDEKRELWKAFGLHSPPATPLGFCGIRREATLIAEDGTREVHTSPTLSLRME